MIANLSQFFLSVPRAASAIAAIALCSLAFSGCASTPEKDVLKVGMDKSEVIEAMGPPKRTSRVHNSDRWYYDERQDRAETEVFFQNGKVAHFGKPAADSSATGVHVKQEKGFKPVADAPNAVAPKAVEPAKPASTEPAKNNY